MNKTTLFRAYCDWPYETAVFVEANDHQSASIKISRLVGALYGCQPDDVSFYNLDSYLELIDEKGVCDDLDFRLFESGWDADGVASWVDSALFLAPLSQSFLLAAWGRHGFSSSIHDVDPPVNLSLLDSTFGTSMPSAREDPPPFKLA